MGLLLAIDTCLEQCAIALRGDDGVVHINRLEIARGHAEALPGQVRTLFAAQGRTPAEITKIVVTTGPGSFTGVRVGLAYARGLALACGAPCLGLSTLQAYADPLSAGDPDALAFAAIPAPMQQIYLAGFRAGACVDAPRLLALEAAKTEIDMANRAGGRLILCGPAALQLGFAKEDGVILSPQTHIDPAALAQSGARLDPALAKPDPCYLRAPDAKPPRPPSRPQGDPT